LLKLNTIILFFKNKLTTFNHEKKDRNEFMELMEFIAAEYNRFNNERDPELSKNKFFFNLL